MGIPLCQAGDTCTLREAAIICACLREHSIPPLHAAAGLLKIAEMDYNGVNSLFLRVLLEKKYALPFRVLDALVFHFLKFRQEKRQLPVLWHQSLLVFCSIYAADISEEQKEALLDLLKHQVHAQIGDECRRQLVRTAPIEIATSVSSPPPHLEEAREYYSCCHNSRDARGHNCRGRLYLCRVSTAIRDGIQVIGKMTLYGFLFGAIRTGPDPHAVLDFGLLGVVFVIHVGGYARHVRKGDGGIDRGGVVRIVPPC